MALSFQRSRKLLAGFGLTAACILGAFTAPVSADSGNYAVKGSAYDPKSDKLLYREFYSPLDENRVVTVTYTRPDGTTFATKKLTYSGEIHQPEFEMHDTRDDEKISARFESGRLVLSHSLNFSTNEKTIMDNASTVIDAGFDAFIQKNWGKITSGKKVQFDFAMPTRSEAVKLVVQEVPSGKSLAYNYKDPKGWRYFSITPAHKFHAIFAKPIHLAYSPNDKYLMRYLGRSNLDDDKGKQWDVRIEYEYQ